MIDDASDKTPTTTSHSALNKENPLTINSIVEESFQSSTKLENTFGDSSINMSNGVQS